MDKEKKSKVKLNNKNKQENLVAENNHSILLSAPKNKVVKPKKDNSKQKNHKKKINTQNIQPETKLPNKKTEKPHYQGHRKRLRAKLLKNKLDSLTELELLELILFHYDLRHDVKPMAKKLLIKFKSIKNIIHSEPQELMLVQGCNERLIAELNLMRLVIEEILTPKIENNIRFYSIKDIVEFFKHKIGYKKVEMLYYIFLNNNNELIEIKLHSKGTHNFTSIIESEILRQALINNAAKIVLIHNHPSNNYNPSEADIVSTQHINSLCTYFNIELADHIIIIKDNFYSFKQQKHI